MYTLQGVSSAANFIAAYKESQLNRDSHFLIRSVFFVSKGNLFDVYYQASVKYESMCNRTLSALATSPVQNSRCVCCKHQISRRDSTKTVTPGNATITSRSPSQTPRGQNQTSPNRTNVRKALRIALSSPTEVVAMLKKDRKTQEQNNIRQDLKKSPRRINHKATKSK